MFPTSGYFRAVNCPFFLSGLCERPYCHFRHSIKLDEKVAGKAENGPSYSTTGSKPYQHTSTYNQGLFQSTYAQPDVAKYSTLAPSEPAGPVETYKTASNSTGDSCTIPNFTNSDQSLPESLDDPLNLASLPKISGLPKPKPVYGADSLPSYVPTPKLHFQSAASVSVPSYNPTPKNISDKRPSRTIEYDPVKNFAFVAQVVSSGEDSSGEADKGDTNQICVKQVQSKDVETLPEANFSEEECTEESGKCKESWHDDDLTDSDEDMSCRNDKQTASIEDKLMDFASLLTPSSQITSKLAQLSGEASPKKSSEPDKNVNRSTKHPASPDSTSKTSDVSQSKAHIHRSHSSNSSTHKSESSRKKHSTSRSISESHSSSHSHSKSFSKSSSKSKNSDSKNQSDFSKPDSKAHVHSSKSSSKSSSSSKTSSTHVDSSISNSKLSHSAKDKKEPSSSSSKKKSSSKDSSHKSLKHTERAGSSNSEKENKHSSMSRHSDYSGKVSSKTSSSTASVSKSDNPSLQNGVVSVQNDHRHKSFENKVKLKQQEKSKTETSSSEIKTTMSSSNLTSSKSKSNSSDSKSSKNDLSPKSNLSDVIVKKESKESLVSVHQMLHKDRNLIKSISNSGEKKKKPDIIIKAEKNNLHKNGSFTSSVNKNSKSKTNFESHNKSIKSSSKTSLNGKSSKEKTQHVKVDPENYEENDGYDSDVQIIEMPAKEPEVFELSESEAEEQPMEEKHFSFSDEVDMLSDSDTFDECLRIFQETERQLAAKAKLAKLTPEQSKKLKTQTSFEEPENILATLGKKRMAHSAANKIRKPITAPAQMRPKMSPAEVMHNRIVEMQKRALLKAAAREGRESELPSDLNGISYKLSENKSNSSPSLLTSSADSALAASKKREAHIPKPATPVKLGTTRPGSCVYSPNSFYSKKRKSDTPGNCEISGGRLVTIASTASKTEKRKAHEPTMTNLKRPIIPTSFGDKVPSNIRQRYLNILIEEYLKFNSEETAFQKAQEEERIVYERACNKNIYIRLLVNAVKKIREEASESQPSSSKKHCPGLTSQPSHMSQSHAATLGGSHAAKTSFTLNRSGVPGKNLPINITGKGLYERLVKYILTEDQLRANGYPRPSSNGNNKVIFYKEDAKDSLLKDNERTCRRCGKRYYVNKDGSPASVERCIYHYGSAYKMKIAGSLESRYSCCSERAGTQGCQVAEFHVNERNKTENLSGYMKTLPSPDNNYKVYSLDCEMVYTKAGLELARVTVVGEDCNTVYESLVKPDTDVIDYNTRFSGITEANMKGVTTNLRGVQAVMLSLISDKTILIGHSLESDLVALKLIHSTVVDTSLVFPHRLGLPYKRALRNLMVDILQKIIQDDAGGHDSKEDAAACMQLMQHKVKEDAKREIRRI
ncbi:RNA exonuclease 1 [Biomphalaria pfeifferi]|uniref:RNA exonuclease 1 n=1 Tax=Biomphalaria pfeifferi TaxID=112525 RepID=A0AAD8BYF6_BIOPF|nr:RNA exonuclease 1 [Biomphalaria pfeifferi]